MKAEYTESDLKGWKDAAKAYRELGVCYRIGKQPSESLFARLEKANILIDKDERGRNG